VYADFIIGHAFRRDVLTNLNVEIKDGNYSAIIGRNSVWKKQCYSCQALAQQLGLPVGGNEVEARQLIREAIGQGHIILSIPVIGYWRSNDRQEVLEYINSLQERADEIYNRSDAIKKAWNAANPTNAI
jgi:orotidine-5'-phosphate decarboxylase